MPNRGGGMPHQSESVPQVKGTPSLSSVGWLSCFPLKLHCQGGSTHKAGNLATKRPLLQHFYRTTCNRIAFIIYDRLFALGRLSCD